MRHPPNADSTHRCVPSSLDALHVIPNLGEVMITGTFFFAAAFIAAGLMTVHGEVMSLDNAADCEVLAVSLVFTLLTLGADDAAWPFNDC